MTKSLILQPLFEIVFHVAYSKAKGFPCALIHLLLSSILGVT